MCLFCSGMVAYGLGVSNLHVYLNLSAASFACWEAWAPISAPQTHPAEATLVDPDAHRTPEPPILSQVMQFPDSQEPFDPVGEIERIIDTEKFSGPPPQPASPVGLSSTKPPSPLALPNPSPEGKGVGEKGTSTDDASTNGLERKETEKCAVVDKSLAAAENDAESGPPQQAATPALHSQHEEPGHLHRGKSTKD